MLALGGIGWSRCELRFGGKPKGDSMDINDGKDVRTWGNWLGEGQGVKGRGAGDVCTGANPRVDTVDSVDAMDSVDGGGAWSFETLRHRPLKQGAWLADVSIRWS